MASPLLATALQGVYSQPADIVLGVLALFVVYHFARAVYLIYLSPLAIFPGSKWAALGEYWEAYWNIGTKPGRKGQTLFKLEQMHKELGAGIRMGPNEVHVYDPAFYHELYRLGSRYYKDPSMHKVLGAPTSTLAESDPLRHKQRKAPLESLFNKKSVLKLEPMLMDHVEYCTQRFESMYASDEPVLMGWALKSLAMDMVSQFAFGESLHALSHPSFQSLPVRVFAEYLPSLHTIKAFPFVRWLHKLPLWLGKRISYQLEMGHELEQFAYRRIHEFQTSQQNGKSPAFPTILKSLLTPIPSKGYYVPDVEGLKDEILTTVSAGNDTTGIANAVTIFNIVNNREIHDRLLLELKTLMPTPRSHAPYSELEKLPYLVSPAFEVLRRLYALKQQTVCCHQRRSSVFFSCIIANTSPGPPRRRNAPGWPFHPGWHPHWHGYLSHPLQRAAVREPAYLRPREVAQAGGRDRDAAEIHGRVLPRQPRMPGDQVSLLRSGAAVQLADEILQSGIHGDVHGHRVHHTEIRPPAIRDNREGYDVGRHGCPAIPWRVPSSR